MVKILQEFLVVVIVIYSINMIYFYFKDKSKKYKNIPTVEMELLMRMYNINLSMIGIKTVQNHISIINAIIMTIDLLILYHIKSMLFAIILIMISTFILIGIFYGILGNYYKKIIYRG